MVFIIGNTRGETHSISVTLASNACSQLYVANTATKFTNRLPTSIEKGNSIRSMGVRIKNLYVCKYSEVPGSVSKKKHYEPMYVMLSGIQGQIVNNSKQCVLAIANVRNACSEAKGRNGEYCSVSFSDAPILDLNYTILNHLSVELCTSLGERYPLWNQGLIVPTILEIEIMSVSTNRDFTITSMSHGANFRLYETNTLASFRNNIGQHMNFESWEVALQSIAIPPFLRLGKKLKFSWSIDNEEISGAPESWRHIEITYTPQLETREDVFRLLDQMIEQHDRNKQLGERLLFYKDEREGIWLFRLELIRTTCHVKCNAPMGVILGLPLDHTFMVDSETDRATRRIPAHCEPEDLIQIPEISFLYSSCVKRNLVGDKMAHLLAVIPMNIFLNDTLPGRGATIYEPKNLTFHDTVEGEISHIDFSLRRADGAKFIILPSVDQHYIDQSGGSIVTLHFRPRSVEEYTYKVTEKISAVKGLKRRRTTTRGTTVRSLYEGIEEDE